MSRCELTGKAPVVKNKVSHSNIKTKSTSFPNVQKKRLFSKTLNEYVSLQIAASAIRDMEHMGGFDTFVLRQKPALLSNRAMKARARIQRKLKAKPTSDTPKAETGAEKTTTKPAKASAKTKVSGSKK